MRSVSQRGLTLVELMVAIALNLLVILAVSMLYLNTRSTQKTVDQRAALLESGQQVLEQLGRDVANAGFYPAVSTEAAVAGGADLSNVLMGFSGATDSAHMNLPDAYRFGIYGCTGQTFDTNGNGCAAQLTGVRAGSDALVVSYFTNDTFSLDVGNRSDCTHADAANDATYNKAERVGSVTTTATDANGQKTSTSTPRTQNDDLVPNAPILVINRYFLDVGGNGNTSLWCRGNGRPVPVELIPNVEQITVRYGVMGSGSAAPVKYMTAADLSASRAQVLDGVSYEPWERVVSVRLCVMVRSDPQTRLNEATSATVTDCAGNSVTQPAGVSFRTFSQVFGVKNRLTGTI